MHEVLGIGAAYVDHIIHVDEDFVATIPGEKGGSHAVDHKTLSEILDRAGTVTTLPGGAGSNLIKGVAHLGHKCALHHMIGNDTAGTTFMESVEKAGITPLFKPCQTPTSQTVCLVTPDGQRTFRAFHGACNAMTGDDLDPKHFEGVKLVHIEGYSLYSPGLAEAAMRLAKENHALVSFCLSSFEVATKFPEEILYLLTHYVDIVFANEDEARTITGSDCEEACRQLQYFVGVAVISHGPKGCWVGCEDSVIHCPAFPVDPVDTIGAGDFFSAGFLHGILQKVPLKECARYGALMGRAAVLSAGAQIEQKHWTGLEEEIGAGGAG